LQQRDHCIALQQQRCACCSAVTAPFHDFVFTFF
jgi:hypothetical protein